MCVTVLRAEGGVSESTVTDLLVLRHHKLR